MSGRYNIDIYLKAKNTFDGLWERLQVWKMPILQSRTVSTTLFSTLKSSSTCLKRVDDVEERS